MDERADYADYDIPPGGQTAFVLLGMFLGAPVAICLLCVALAVVHFLTD